MKAILVIDEMPSNCLDCPCEYDFIRCKALNHQLDYCTADKERPSWCPLKPMPDRACERLVQGLNAIEKMKSVEVKVIRRTK